MEENKQNATKREKGCFGWAVLGFFFPLVGFILFLCWKNDRSGDAKMAGIGALVGVGVSILTSVLTYVFFGDMIMQMMNGIILFI